MSNIPRKSQELTDFQRGMIVGLRRAGWTFQAIADDIGSKKNTVRDVFSKWEKEGITTVQPRPGAPKKLDDRDLRQLVRVVKKNRRATAAEITIDFASLLGKDLSIKTIRNYLKELGFRGCAGVRKPLVTEKNRIARLEWARDHRTWSVDQ